MSRTSASGPTSVGPPRVAARAALVFLVATSACGGPDPNAEPVDVVIPRGATWSAAVDSLVAHGVIASRWRFQLAARVRGAPDKLKAGTYVFRPNERFGTVLDALIVGRGKNARLVIPEGLMLSEIAAIVEDALEIPVDAFIGAATDSSAIADVGLGVASLEGYLYPETYLVSIDVTPRALVTLMAREFLSRWTPDRQARIDELGWTLHEMVTFASIVEGEARVVDESPLIASVYHNRIRRGMRLQADPTVIYALGERRRLWERDYLIDHPYNTYQISGLPPGPIGSPGQSSIDASLFPATSSYFYFVASPDGRHIFSRTLAEHERARRQVRQMRATPSRPTAAASSRPPPDLADR